MGTEVVQQIVNGLMIGGMYSLIALGLTLVFGIMDIVNFAHGEVVMIGAFACFFLNVVYHMDFFVSLLLTMLLVSFLGIVLERSTFRFARKQPINGLVISIGLGAILQNLALTAWGADGRFMTPPFRDTLTLFGVTFAHQRLLAFIVTMVLIFAFYVFIKFSSTGKQMRATAQDGEAAALMGLDIERMNIVAFALGSAMAAAAGGFLGSLFSISPFMGGPATVKGVVVIVLGGLGSMPGAVAGGLILGVVESLGAGFVSSAFRDGFAFVAMLLVLLFRPSGLFGHITTRT